MKISDYLRLPVIISALPNTIANGQTIDAVPVMADFNHIVNQVNANAADVTLVALLAAANSFTQVQSGVAATAAANFPIATQVQNFVFNTLTSTLGTNTITARIAQLTLGAYASGQVFTFVPSQTNTGPVTLNINGVGVASIVMGGTNLTTGTLIKDLPLAVRYEPPAFNVIGGLPVQRRTFTGSLTGCTTVPTATFAYTITSGVVTLSLNSALTGTSNTTACTVTGLPPEITPVTTHALLGVAVDNGSATVAARLDVTSAGTLILYVNTSSAVFTGSGTKGLPNGITLVYDLS